VIEAADRDGVAVLRMADGKANAMSIEFCEALTARFEAMSSARAVVVTGSGRIGVTELLVGVPFPPVAMEIMRRAMAPQYFEEALFGAATYPPAEAIGRGLIHEIVDPPALTERAIAAAKSLAALPPAAFALTKRQIRRPALQRLEQDDAAIEAIWTAPETLERIRDYVARTLRKS